MTIVLENANETVLDSIKDLVKNFNNVKYTVEPSFAVLQQKAKEAKEIADLKAKLADKNRWQKALDEASKDEEYKKEIMEWERLG
ncbi:MULTISPECIES: hypothetical protein [Campylobacter]|uniref:hypothetical protein n=1 Tax=Campylobacter TaxID=194 RepID=UPI0009C2845B|nr:hypothetical protein [Campylobacter helveticus]MDL0100958.1 hypothetical protein [Campylobacter felis]ARE80601.1 hypothetical protein CHELV3228_1011 [Campylobacter helveticus]MCR2060476.1 hypothetical protein [Campylobacter helveticus]TNH32654.1 hypothetical protein FDW48_06535 [Campylobacter helveticus]TNH33876.1 hypothetical protein FDW46_05555 [Campylobacter helveticus]